MAKSAEAFRTISEAADEIGVAQHVLRFWETKFTFVRPMKRAGGRRFYRPSDVAVLASVRRLLHDEGYTIKGVQKLYREAGAHVFGQGSAEAGEGASARPPGTAGGGPGLAAALAEVEAAMVRLDAVLGRA